MEVVLKSSKRKTGFTLIELLVVIAIISILAALILPALVRAKAQAQSTSCKNHLHQMGIALKLYLDENQGRYPYVGYQTTPSVDSFVEWPQALKPYYRLTWTNRNFHCPGYKFELKLPSMYNDGHPVDGGYVGSYGYNWAGTWDIIKMSGSSHSLGLGDQLLGPFGALDIPTVPPQVLESQLKAPSEMLAIGDSRSVRLVAGWNPTKYSWLGESVLNCGDLAAPDWHSAFPRHGQNYNFLFCDGRVAATAPAKVFNPTNSAPLWNNDHQPHPETW
jgi:prepilin-type N-terminal cleavage/methylation domain-containing protein/prepilin-type processing-associated H-X9-DG protein